MPDAKTTIRTILVLAILAAFLVFCARHAVDVNHLRHEETHPPIEQIRESVDAPPEGERSGMWPTVRKHYVLKHSECAACGSEKNLNVHHIKPFHLHPELELDMGNLITLCAGSSENGNYNCHFRIGHDPDGPLGPRTPSWKASNPNVRSDARSAYR
jgi:5-methylcytosine-specific restriction endonuclease McrA